MVLEGRGCVFLADWANTCCQMLSLSLLFASPPAAKSDFASDVIVEEEEVAIYVRADGA
jgi:hypothetical protein